MAGNIPMPSALWTRDRDDIPPPWADALIHLDLIYWFDEKACDYQRMPGPSALARTWGRNRTTVYRIIARFKGALKSKRKGKATVANDRERLRTDVTNPTEDEGGIIKGDEQKRTDLNDRERSRTPLITRAPTSPSPTPPPSPEELSDLQAWKRLRQVWAEKHAKSAAQLKASLGLGKEMMSRLREYGEPAVESVLRWYDGPSRRAKEDLRARGYALSTLLSPERFPGYLEAATAPPAAPDGDEGAHELAWLTLTTSWVQRSGLPDPLDPDPVKAQATRDALKAVGGFTRFKQGDTRYVYQQKPAFVAAYRDSIRIARERL